MRRYLFASSLFLVVSTLTLAVWAQEAGPAASGGDAPLVIANPPALQIAGEWRPVELKQVDLGQQPLTTLAGPAADSCSQATPLTFAVGGGGDGGVTTLLGTSEDIDDPILPSGCSWGTLSNAKGYRTVWYSFVAPSFGWVTIDTRGSDYDTIVSVYQGTCPATATVPVSCDDDSMGFTSKATFLAEMGQTYYIEVVDWQADPPSGGGVLSLFANMQAVNSRWQSAGVMPLARSRHAAVVVGDDIYVIGGQSGVLGTPVVEKRLDRFDTKSGTWTPLRDMPGTAGYANTTAAYVDGPSDDGRIYLPSGYTGNNAAFGGTHWAYDIASDQWMTATTAPWPSGKPIAWSTAVATNDGYYLTGGLSVFQTNPLAYLVHPDVFFFSPSSGWQNPWPPQMNNARYGHVAAQVGGQICVAGGSNSLNAQGNPEPLGDTECYTPGGTWQVSAATLNYPRYNAGSAVGPDGKWYVFGGLDADAKPVPVVEVYDPARNSWSALDVTFDLGGDRTGVAWPSRAWPRGGFVDSNLWTTGGNNSSSEALPLVEKLFVSSEQLFMPVVASRFSINQAADDTFGSARRLTLNVPQDRNFDTLQDLVDVYFFDLPAAQTITATLTNVPAGSDYNLSLYSFNKFLWGVGNNPGHVDESISVPLFAGRYFLMVERFSPTGDPDPANYRVEVQD